MARIIFMGTPDFAAPIVRALADASELGSLVAVVTQPDRPAGRGRKLVAPPVKVLARERGIPVLQPTKLRKTETHDALRVFAADVVVVAAYGRILPEAVLTIPRLGCINVHASLLPKHRGASPIAHAILAGDQETGISIMQMDKGMDTGPIFRRDAIPLPDGVTCGGLFDILAAMGAESLMAALPGILDGSAVAEPQDDKSATYAPLLKKEDGRIDFRGNAIELERCVRAFSPWPGAFAELGDVRVRIHWAQVADGIGEPGLVLTADSKGVIVACGEGALCLDEVQPAGRKRMPAAAWVAGRGVEAGARFELPTETAR
ncbi:MAG: methionyl-tRNA formyltransferase [Myxococcota bacterium]